MSKSDTDKKNASSGDQLLALGELSHEVAIIAAVAENRVVGFEGKMPWRLSADLRHFRSLTEGKIVIMGRKTYESIGLPLPNRTNFIVTRRGKPEDFDERCLVFHSFSESLLAADKMITDFKSKDAGVPSVIKPEIMVIGGAEIYQLAMSIASRVYLTEVHATPKGDALFPRLDLKVWRRIERQRFRADEKNQYDYSFVTLER